MTLELDRRCEDIVFEELDAALAAGPSVLATELLLMSREPERWMHWTGALLLAWSLCLPVMLASLRLRKLLGERGLTAIERLMGLILVTIAVEMLMTGVSQWWSLHK